MLSAGPLRLRHPRAPGLAYLVLVCLILGHAYGLYAQSTPAGVSDAAGPFSAVGIGTGTRPITGLWQFHLGDDPAWAQPGFDDRGWERLPANRPWGDAGHPGYTGFAWYRRQIALDPADREPLALLLPPLGSAAEVYWNGVKVGGVGTPPPHAQWPGRPETAAVPLPSAPGARSGELAIRVWEHRLVSLDPPDAGGFQAAPQIGYRPLIQAMPHHEWEHRFCVHAIANACYLSFFLVGIAALVLWTRSRSQWVLLAVGAYLLSYALEGLLTRLPGAYTALQVAGVGISAVQQIASLFVILLLAGLPSRRGLRGARFWWRACIFISGVQLLSTVLTLWEVLIITSPQKHLFQFLDVSSELLAYAFIPFVLVLLVACFALSRLTLPRLLFLSAVGIDVLLGLSSNLLVQNLTRMDWLVALLTHPVLQIYGAGLSIFSTVRFLVLLAIIYAVSDQIRRQVARQRFVDAELRAAQEIQQVMVPAAAEREAPGYAVSSVYRPASEVGGDFFQIIPLEGDGKGNRGTLIVAGDVSGKGLRAAMTVSLVVGTLRTLAEFDLGPAAVLAGLNRRLIGRTQGGFVTCCAVRIDAEGRATMANAGHCHPYLDGHEVDLPSCIPLGIVADAEYEETTVDVSHGQQLTLLSDGVVEARNPHGELYGFDRLTRFMQQRPTAEQVADTAVAFGQEDDITVLTVTRLASA